MQMTSTQKPSLPLNKQITYAIGQLGWSTLVNIIGLQLLYFYLPPENAGLPELITGATFFVVLNAITLIAASGRLLDALTDPLIASFSDRFNSPQGRRIPFMRLGALPAAIFCTLMFVPLVRSISSANIVWLVVTQALFYIFLTVYVTPYFALLPELGHTATERLNLSTWISITYALGIMLAAQTPVIATALQTLLNLSDKLTALQYAVGLLAGIATLLMYVPVLTIDEKTYCDSIPSNVPLLPALKATLQNRNFIFYVLADFAYFMGLTLIQTGLLYYVTVLLLQEEALVGSLLAITVLLSFVFYPLVNLLARRIGKKILISGSFFFMSLIFLFVFFSGEQVPLPHRVQAYLVVILFALPIAFLGVLPNAVLADIAGHDALKTGEKKEGMYFAARTLLQKFGQTSGILVFAMLTTFGFNPGQDLGIRLSGLAGFGLCFLAGVVFTRYKERELLRETHHLTSGGI
jgi:GPH family glycoside/pentoside/hexuronide:cation symporter